MVDEKKKEGKVVKKRADFADKGLARYNELLKMQIDFNKEFKPLKRYLIEMGKLPKPDKKKKG